MCEGSEQFPVGLRVLVVDDDEVCLKVLDQMLRKCKYAVTACSQATLALDLLRERRGYFDIVLSDVHMPDMDGFKLLELVGLEMDLPVIMMSGDGRTNLVMRGVQHGACDYLIKPIRDEELKNIWQHVVRRRKCVLSREYEHSDNDGQKQAGDEVDNASSAVLKSQKKKRGAREEEDDAELENDDPTSAKKPRVVWSVELHQQFVSAVNQLGIDKAVPKKILEMMNAPGLARENVASHLQKFRLYLKRLSRVAEQKGGFPSSFCGPPVEHNPKLCALGRFDIQALAASSQIPPQTLAAFHAELLGWPAGNLVLPAAEHPASSNISNQFPQPIMSVLPVFGSWPTPGSNHNAPNRNMLMQRPKQQQQKQCGLPDPNSSISVKPSHLVKSRFQVGNEDCRVDYGIISPQSTNSSSGIGKASDKELKLACGYNSLFNEGSLSPCVSSCSISTDNGDRASDVSGISVSYNTTRLDQTTPGFGKGVSIPSRFAVDETVSPICNSSALKYYGDGRMNKVKQEPTTSIMENDRFGLPIVQHFPPDDLMSLFSVTKEGSKCQTK